MILPDVNLLLNAHNSRSPLHLKAVAWWNDCLAGSEEIALAWVVILGFVRICTNARVFGEPMSVEEALANVGKWLSLPHVSIHHPSAGHFAILDRLLRHAGTGGNLTTDAHLAALAIEKGFTLHSGDTDFAKFPGLKWLNPLAGG